MIKINNKCKGARDILSKDMRTFRFIENIFINACAKWGYEEVRTPTLEYLHLFTSAGTLSPNMINRVYSFLDWDGWSGERVVLRPDGTIPVARLYLENLSDLKIAKLFYITNVFLFESTGKESRERWQFGIEYLGNDKVVTDLETIILATEILKKLGIGSVHLKVSHAGLVKSLIRDLKLNEKVQNKMVNDIKNGNWKEILELAKNNKNEYELLLMLTNIKGKSTGYLENIKALHNISRETLKHIDNLAAITTQLDSLKIRYRIDITSARDFEYYTGLSFQLLSNNKLLGAGGRYNNLIPLMGGRQIPACGMALYFDELMKLVNIKNEFKEKVAIILPKEHNFDISLLCNLTNSLCDSGYLTELDWKRKKEGFRWIININPKTKIMNVLDTTSDTKYKTDSIKSIIKILERKN